MRGGKRKGAGRPCSDNKRIKTSVTIEPELIEWAREQKTSMANLVNAGLKLLKAGKLDKYQ